MNLDQFIGRTKGVLTIISFNLSEYLKTNLKAIKANCRCSRCGEIVQVRLDRILGKYKLYEKACCKCKSNFNLEQAKNKFIGNTYGILTVLEFDHFENKRMFFKCKCNRCGETTVVRSDRFTHTLNLPQSCEHCYYQLLGEKSLERYMKFHGFDNKEEYILDKIFREKIGAIKRGAIDRNISYELSDTFAKSLLTQNCYYCDEPIANGIDRIDSNKGYTEDNVVPCCGVCNIMKNAFSQEVFYNKIDKIYNKHLKISSTTIESTSKDGSELSTLQAKGNGNVKNPKGL